VGGSPATKRNILNAAAKIFISHGYRNAKTKEIAKEAKISEALLFKYFRTKHELYVEFVKEEIRQRLPESEHYFNLETNATDILFQFVNDVLSNNDKTPKFIQFFVEMVTLQNSYFIMNDINMSTDILDHLLIPIIQKGQQAGEIKEGDARVKAEIYWRFIIGSVLSNANFPEKNDPVIFHELHRLLFVKE